jgi:RNA-binding protein YhbY
MLISHEGLAYTAGLIYFCHSSNSIGHNHGVGVTKQLIQEIPKSVENVKIIQVEIQDYTCSSTKVTLMLSSLATETRAVFLT